MSVYCRGVNENDNVILTGFEDLKDFQWSVANILDVVTIVRWNVADITGLPHNMSIPMVVLEVKEHTSKLYVAASEFAAKTVTRAFPSLYIHKLGDMRQLRIGAYLQEESPFWLRRVPLERYN